MINRLLEHAITVGASDIHVEHLRDMLRIRMRIDGLLQDMEAISIHQGIQVISRLKVLGGMDIAEKRIPQDGMMRFDFEGRNIDMRLSTFPAVYGEKLVIRILDQNKQALTLSTLGLSEQLLADIKQIIMQPSGLFLVTGPTGSGKTTTLYAALSEIQRSEKNIITLEDPVEYYMHNITQGQINPMAGFTFEKGIRAMLRQDPDIIMVGEIRDQQTARIAIQAALTGHLVLSTMHTNDAPSVVMRLLDMGIEPYLINAALSGVLAQRLVGRLCRSCCQESHDGNDVAFHALGCTQCLQRGFKGRIGIFQFLAMSPEIRACINTSPDIDQLSERAYEQGMKKLIDDGYEKVKQGEISVADLIKATI